MNSNFEYVSRFDLAQHTVSFYDSNQNSIVKMRFTNNYYNVNNMTSYHLNIGSTPVKYTSFSNVSLILGSSGFNYTNESVVVPKIYFLNLEDSNNTYFMGKELYIGCSIPQLYVNQYADICINNDIKLLSSTILAGIQEYGNTIHDQNNIANSLKDINPYGFDFSIHQPVVYTNIVQNVIVYAILGIYLFTIYKWNDSERLKRYHLF